MRFFTSFRKVLSCAILTAAALAGCGESSGPAPTTAATVTGTAATGAAIAAGTVTLKCVSGTTTSATTGTDGSFTIDVSGVTLPCLARVDYKDASGTAQKLHTIITATGTANITPVTELVVANLTGGAATDAFDKFDVTKAKTYTAALVKTAATAVKNYLKNTLGVDTTNLPDDPVGTKFVPAVGTTAGDKADKVLDDLAARLKGSGKKLSDLVGDIAKGGSGGSGSTSGGVNVTTPGNPSCYQGYTTSTAAQFAADMGAASSPVTVTGDIGLFASFSSPPVDLGQTLRINTDGSVTVNGTTVNYALFCKGPAIADPFFSSKLNYTNFISLTSFGGTGDGGQFYVKNDNSIQVNDYPTDGAQKFVFRSPSRFASLTKTSASGTVNVTGSASYSLSLADSYVNTKAVVVDSNPPAKTSTNVEIYLYGGSNGAIFLTFDTSTAGGPYLLEYNTGVWFNDGNGVVNGSDSFDSSACPTPSTIYSVPTCTAASRGVTLNTGTRTITFNNTRIGGTASSTRAAILNGTVNY